MENNESILRSFINSFIKDDFFVDIVNIGLYPSEFTNVTFSKENSMSNYIKNFLNDLVKSCKKLNVSNIKNIYEYVSLSISILNIKESKSSIVNYDNIFQHLLTPTLLQQKLIQFVINNRLPNSESFRKKIETITTNIQIFHEVQSISSSILLFDNFLEIAKKPNTIIETAKLFKESVIQLYNELSKLQSITKLESEKDYFIISDKESVNELTETEVEYIANNYSFFNTGYNFIDMNVDGIESGAVHVFAAPSNHGKSIFKVNLLNLMIRNNISDFDPNDAILFITLEDNIFKLKRRLCSIFGNIDAYTIKMLYKKSYILLKEKQYNKIVKDKISKIINNMIFDSIFRVTNNKVKLIVKQGDEGNFSAGDLSKFIDLLKVENSNTRLVFEDYIDVKSPTMPIYSQADEYFVQGIIVQEQRTLTKRYKIPIITSTQLKRGSDNISFPLESSMIGDSDKKRRYSDYLYLFRQDNMHDVFDPEIIKHVLQKNNISNGTINPKIRVHYDRLKEDLIPLEIKITKAKDSKRDQHGYLVFCKKNLRIYNNIEEYINDMDELDNNTKNLEAEIDNILDYITDEIDFNI